MEKDVSKELILIENAEAWCFFETVNYLCDNRNEILSYFLPISKLGKPFVTGETGGAYWITEMCEISIHD